MGFGFGFGYAVPTLLHYAHGKPKETVEVGGLDGNPLITEIRRVIVKEGEDE